MEHINYQFGEIIGVGGMSTVYKGTHKTLLKPVAIKVLKKEFINNVNIRKRFLDEARNMFSMNHSNIIRSTDLIDQEDIVAFVMELIEGKTIKQYLDEKGKLDDYEISLIFNQMLLAVNYIHQNGLVHRDLKPSNFMLNKQMKIKLMDFGIAKDSNLNSNEFTNTMLNMGTTIYMSPEQIRSTKDVTCQSDIYSIGVLLWQMVTGEKPYEIDTLSTFDIQVKIVNESLPLTNTRWDEIIQKATEKELEKRFKSCQEIEIYLKNFTSEKKDYITPPKVDELVNENKYYQYINPESWGSGTINSLKWHRKIGDYVKKGEIIAEVETDKATLEIEAENEGYIIARTAKQKIKFSELLIEISKDKQNYIPEEQDAYKWITGKNNENKITWGCIDKKGNWIIEPLFIEQPFFDDNKIAQVELNNKWGFINNKGEWKVKPMFDSQQYLNSNEFYYVNFNEKIGIINKIGNWIMQPIIDTVIEFGKKEICGVKLNEKWILINKEGDQINNDYYEDIDQDYDKLIFYKKNNKWGIIDHKGQIITLEIFEEIKKENDEKIIRFKKNNLWGCLSQTGEEIIKPQFDALEYINGSNYKKAVINNLKGIINEKGDWIIKPLFYDIEFKEKENKFLSASIWDESKDEEIWGIIDYDGNWICKPMFYSLELCNTKGFFIATDKDSNEGIVDKDGNWKINPELEEGEIWFQEIDKNKVTYSKVAISEKYGIVSNEGKWILNCYYEDLGIIDELNEKGIIQFKKEDKYGWIDLNGIVRIPAIYEEIYYNGFNNNKYAQVKFDGKWGFIDIKGNWIVQPILNDSVYFGEENIAIGEVIDNSGKSKDGLIDKNGKWIIEPIHENLLKLDNKGTYYVFTIEIDEKLKYGIKNSNGETLFEPTFRWISTYRENEYYIPAIIDSNCGLINVNGLWLIEPDFDDLHDLDQDNHYKAFKNGKYGFIDKYGNWIVKPILEELEQEVEENNEILDEDYIDDEDEVENDVEDDVEFDPRPYFKKLTGIFSSTYVSPTIPEKKLQIFASFFKKEFILNCEFYVFHEDNEKGEGIAIVKHKYEDAWFILVNYNNEICDGFCLNAAEGWKQIEKIYLEDSKFIPYIYIEYLNPNEYNKNTICFNVGLTGKIKQSILKMWNENF